MWKLSIEDDQGAKTLVSLVREEYTLGRAEDNTVRLTERNVSRHHAKVGRRQGSWYIQDLDSYNGVFVNGVRVSGEQRLSHGDFVQVGDYRLELINETTTNREGRSRADTIREPTRRDTLVSQHDRLVMIVGPTPNAEYPLDAERVVIGRGEECEISINHPSVSRVHAEIRAMENGRYEILDKGSANGVRINAVELTRSLLDSRDLIELGDVVLKLIPAGQIYAPTTDETQQANLLALSNDSTSSSLRPTALGKMPTLAKAGIGAAMLALLLAGGFVALTRGGATPNVPEAELASAAGTTSDALMAAERLLDSGDVEAAHQKLKEIPSDSNARKSSTFRRVEAAWADALLERAESTNDVDRRRALLDRVAKSTTVDSVRRQQAANLLSELDAESVDVSELPESQPPSVQPAAVNTADIPDGARTPVPQPKKRPVQRRASDKPAGKPGNATELATSGDREKVERAKNMLLAKKNAGTATDQELKMLRALCRQLGDGSCSD